MGKILEELWEQLHPDYFSPTLKKLFAIETMVKLSKSIDSAEKKELLRLIDEANSETTIQEKRAFRDGVCEGCKIMVEKL